MSRSGTVPFTQKLMTLEEYINQKDPERMPHVILKIEEYTEGVRRKTRMGDVHTQIFITSPLFHQAFPEARGEYLMMGKWPRLYAVDSDGNPKGASCFRIEL